MADIVGHDRRAATRRTDVTVDQTPVVEWSSWYVAAGAVVAGLVLVWLVAVALLWRASPQPGLLREAVRLLPDLVRLVRRLAADGTLPRGVRVRLWLLLAYLALPPIARAHASASSSEVRLV